MNKQTFAITMALALAAGTLCAQQEGGRPPRGGGSGTGGSGVQRGTGGQQGGQGGERQRPKPPIIAALDANGDGTIDASEIAKASESLKKLDKNGDGKLTQDECMPSRPQGGQGGGEGRRNGQGQGGPGQGGPGQGGQGGHGGQGPGGQGAAGGGAARPELEK